MPVELELAPVDRVPRGSHVHHYDELPDCVKTRLPRLVDSNGDGVRVPDEVGAAFEPYDVVKYTDYYRITVSDGTTRARVSR